MSIIFRFKTKYLHFQLFSFLHLATSSGTTVHIIVALVPAEQER